MPLSAEALSELLGTLYEAAASPERWPVFLSALDRAGGADASLLVTVSPEGEIHSILSDGFDPSAAGAYRRHYCRHDELLSRFIAARQLHGEWIGTRQSVMPEAEFERSTIYNEFARPLGLKHQCGAMLGGLDGGVEAGVALEGAADRAGFGEDTIRLLAMLAPHVKRALTTHRTLSDLRARHAGLLESVESFSLAVLSLGAGGRVIRASSTAMKILEARDGVQLEEGTLRATRSGEQTRLSALIAGAVATGSG
ncbi:MAG: hypothetical protein WCE75_13390, partial [Terracidiphilus sp.]